MPCQDLLTVFDGELALPRVFLVSAAHYVHRHNVLARAILNSVLKKCQKQAPPLCLRHDMASEARVKRSREVDEEQGTVVCGHGSVVTIERTLKLFNCPVDIERVFSEGVLSALCSFQGRPKNCQQLVLLLLCWLAQSVKGTQCYSPCPAVLRGIRVHPEGVTSIPVRQRSCLLQFFCSLVSPVIHAGPQDNCNMRMFFIEP